MRWPTPAERSPTLLLDFATLTGAARIALGPDLPALYCNDEAVAARLARRRRAAARPLWRMPLWRPYLRYLKSTIADIANGGPSRMAGSITAALYLERFVPEGAAVGARRRVLLERHRPPGQARRRRSAGPARGVRVAEARASAAPVRTSSPRSGDRTGSSRRLDLRLSGGWRGASAPGALRRHTWRLPAIAASHVTMTTSADLLQGTAHRPPAAPPPRTSKRRCGSPCAVAARWSLVLAGWAGVRRATTRVEVQTARSRASAAAAAARPRCSTPPATWSRAAWPRCRRRSPARCARC